MARSQAATYLAAIFAGIWVAVPPAASAGVTIASADAALGGTANGASGESAADDATGSGRRLVRREKVAVAVGSAGDNLALQYPVSNLQKHAVNYVPGEGVEFWSSSRSQWFMGKVAEVKDGNVKLLFTAPNGIKTSKTMPADDEDLRRPVKEAGASALGDIHLMKSAGTALREIAMHGNLDGVLHDLGARPLAADSMLAEGEKESQEEQNKVQQSQHAKKPCPTSNHEAIIEVGFSDISEKCIKSPEPVSCPTNAGDMDIRRNPESGKESFDVTVSGSKTVCVRRKDKNAGWTMNLQLVCNKQAAVTVQLGMSETATKCVVSFPRVTCTWNAANYGIRAGTGDASDEVASEEGSFFVESLQAGATTSQSRVCVTRLDGTGWDFNVEFHCNVLDQAFSYDAKVVELAASPNRNDHCQTLPKLSDQLQCSTNAADFKGQGKMQLEVISEHSSMKPMGGTRICARRVDKEYGWQNAVHVLCSSKGHIIFGPSLVGNLKCINLDQPVQCVDNAADVGNRVNPDEDPGVFDVTSNGNTVCVRRKDRLEGWSMDLRIACTPMTGYRSDHNARGDLGTVTLQASSRRRREAWLQATEDPSEANIVTDGLLVWLQHEKLGWLGCTMLQCSAGKSQAPDRFRIFSETQRANSPLLNGMTVYVRQELSLQYMSCDGICQANSGCPVESGRSTDFSKCINERFKIYNSAGSGPIRDGDNIWLMHSNNRLISCASESDGCIADGLCASGPESRSYLTDASERGGCAGERIRIFTAQVGQKDKQSSAVLIGASDEAVKCVQRQGDSLTCAINSGDMGYRYPVGDHISENPSFEITTRGSEVNNFNFEVCARRTDKYQGWSILLNISCAKRAMTPSWPHDVPSLLLWGGASATPEALPSKASILPDACLGWAPSSGPLQGKGGYCGKFGESDPWCWVAKNYTGPGKMFKRESKHAELKGKWFAPGCTVEAPDVPGPISDKDEEVVAGAGGGKVGIQVAAEKAAWAAAKAAKSHRLPAGKTSTEAAKHAAALAIKAAVAAAVSEAVKAATNQAAISAAQSAGKAAAEAIGRDELGEKNAVGKKDGTCYEPASACVAPFNFGGKYYMGCIKDKLGQKSWCSLKTLPSAAAKNDWVECSAVPCTEVCFEPDEKCVDPFKYNGESFAGCIKEPDGQAWCPHVQMWSTTAYDEGSWSWCKQKGCSKACWEPSAGCTSPFTWKDRQRTGCVESEDPNKPAWCSQRSHFEEGDTDYVYCKQVSCNQVAAGSGDLPISAWESDEKLQEVETLGKHGVAFNRYPPGVACLGGQELFAGKASLQDCAERCFGDVRCKSMQYGKESSSCPQCTLSTADCETPGPNNCDGLVITYEKTSMEEEEAAEEQMASQASAHPHIVKFDEQVGDGDTSRFLGTGKFEQKKSSSEPKKDGSQTKYRWSAKVVQMKEAAKEDLGSPREGDTVTEAQEMISQSHGMKLQKLIGYGFITKVHAKSSILRRETSANNSEQTMANNATGPSDSWHYITEQGKPGDASCPCVGIAGNGTLETTMEKTGVDDDGFVSFPMFTGSGCNAWDDSIHPSCLSASEKPAWCDQKWCFVDPCNCNGKNFYRKSTAFGDATYQGKSLAYSYLTCGAEDHYEPKDSHDDDWVVGTGQNGARTAKDQISCSDEAAVASDIGMYNCQCIGFGNSSGVLSVVKDDGVGTWDFTADTGSSCAVWDMSSSPLCAGSGKNTPKWCGKKDQDDPWCFVDPCSCSIAVPPEPAVMAPGLKIGNRPVFYSRATCQSNSTQIWSDREMATSCLGFLDKASCDSARVGKCIWNDDGICIDSLRQNCPREALRAMVPASGATSHNQAACRKEICPFGMSLKSSAKKGATRCSQTPCMSFDIFTCCAQSATCETFGDCGEGSLLRKGTHFCQGSVCTIESDFHTCCEARASCQNFPPRKCPVGSQIVENPDNVTCSGRECDVATDFSRCCEEDKKGVLYMLLGMVLVAVVVAGCVGKTILNRHNDKAVMQTRQDPADGQILTYQQLLAKYKKQHSVSEIILMWNACKVVLDENTAATKMQAVHRGKMARREVDALKTMRNVNGESMSFAEFQAANPGVPLEAQKAQFVGFPEDGRFRAG
jgi:hypothetical protein